MTATVIAVSSSRSHTFSKPNLPQIDLVEGLGVRGDAHSGVTVKHRSRVRKDPDQPNLRQVHLIHHELFDQLASAGHRVAPGDLGENITTSGVDLLALPVGTRLSVGDEVVLTVTGLRNPCHQIEEFQDGLLKQVVGKDDAGEVVRLTGVMSIVSRGGTVRPGDPIGVELPPEPHHRLAVV